MSTPALVPNPIPVNSTSYADVAGLSFGIDRLQGETTDVYVNRLNTIAVENRTHSYEGVVNAIAFALGLEVQPGIEITGPSNTVVTCDLSGISLVSGANSLLFPLAVLGEDNVWDWNTLSEAVSAINATNIWQATLLSPDGPAVLICRQTNAGVGMPYECVTSDVGLIGLTEPSLPALAITSSGGLSYQMHEFLQSIMQTDQSYWAR
jgi:hypothetical protein